MRSRKLALLFCFIFLAFSGLGTKAKSASLDNVLTAIHRNYEPTVINDLDDTQQNEIICASLNLYHEARGSSTNDVQAVGFSTRNRARASGNSFCGVIWEKGQYVWTKRPLSGIMPRDRATWSRMIEIARSIVMDDTLDDPTHGADSFFSRKILAPAWARKSPIRIPIGGHVYVKLLR
jgi:hypothetical protein